MYFWENKATSRLCTFGHFSLSTGRLYDGCRFRIGGCQYTFYFCRFILTWKCRLFSIISWIYSYIVFVLVSSAFLVLMVESTKIPPPPNSCPKTGHKFGWQNFPWSLWNKLLLYVLGKERCPYFPVGSLVIVDIVTDAKIIRNPNRRSFSIERSHVSLFLEGWRTVHLLQRQIHGRRGGHCKQ
jgi:hypothetical protein